MLFQCLWHQSNIETAEADRITEVKNDWGGEDEENDSRDKILRANEHTQKIKFELHSYMYITKLNSQKISKTDMFFSHTKN